MQKYTQPFCITLAINPSLIFQELSHRTMEFCVKVRSNTFSLHESKESGYVLNASASLSCNIRDIQSSIRDRKNFPAKSSLK